MVQMYGMRMYNRSIIDYKNDVNSLLLNISNLIEKFYSKICKEILIVNKICNNIVVEWSSVDRLCLLMLLLEY